MNKLVPQFKSLKFEGKKIYLDLNGWQDGRVLLNYSKKKMEKVKPLS